ncbi:amidophosphoribosyltransferase [Bisgaardia hudsonensis]|nr:amidophosphoribosyltransferase [Bisgaardia hudsonensis]QLB13767.1 amidophosphoribosyltransferase [Bisgaardia hudsonensis]
MNLLNNRCILCKSILAIASHGLCSQCNHSIKRFIYCNHCGSTLAHYAKTCGFCLQSGFYWNNMILVGKYIPPLSDLIHQFKFQNKFWLDRTLARLLLLEIYQSKRIYQNPLPQVLIPVPLHHKRHWQRGYNQSALLGKCLAKWLNIPLEENLIIRSKHTETQRGLNSKKRKKNIKNAFSFDQEILNKWQKCGYKSVAIIDDVITTGATVNEIAKLLHQSNINAIQIWGLART